MAEIGGVLKAPALVALNSVARGVCVEPGCKTRACGPMSLHCYKHWTQKREDELELRLYDVTRNGTDEIEVSAIAAAAGVSLSQTLRVLACLNNWDPRADLAPMRPEGAWAGHRG